MSRDYRGERVGRHYWREASVYTADQRGPLAVVKSEQDPRSLSMHKPGTHQRRRSDLARGSQTWLALLRSLLKRSPVWRRGQLILD